MTDHCLCLCHCKADPLKDSDGLCEGCWRLWCQGDAEHAPAHDRSYLGVYGLSNPWSIWLLGRMSEVMAQHPADLVTGAQPPLCPGRDSMGRLCSVRMLPRPGGWKCYQHKIPVGVPAPMVPSTPRVKIDWPE